ncbi:T9SS type A sorting domain-containing protein [Winogradskyella forsetii]|uniref:T9SS type A sorting domain-containing protein n=1 Tax=Winogradskyella forsetii TaxID=2686077 RepID=UPI0015B84440|nr:T9SS type A sorting domain-containing protein [Winogradskyella forsetii]
MKTKLLLFILPMLLLAATLQAQTKVWDFGGDATYTSPEQIALWPVATFNAAEGVTVEKDNLFLVGDSSGDKFGEIENAGGATWDAGTDDEYTAINRFKFNGGSNPTDFLPSYSYMYFPVTGPVDVKIWFRSGSSSDTERILYISDGTTLLNSFQAVGNGDPETITASYTGTGGNIYIYDSNSFNLYKIEVTGVGADVLGIEDVDTAMSTSVKSVNDRIYISNVTSNTEVSIYSITGTLVKTVNTNTDLDFSFNSGLYFARITTSEAESSVKLLVQ